MKYELRKQSDGVFVGVEATFTLIDFLLFFTSFLLGFAFAFFFLIFAFAVLQKIFARHEFEFNTDTYRMYKYYRFFSYFRFRQREISFSDVNEIVLSNFESGPALIGRGIRNKEWYTLDIQTSSGFIRLAKTEPDELEELFELYNDLQEKLELYFKFRSEVFQ